jgi:hypothetical protein
MCDAHLAVEERAIASVPTAWHVRQRSGDVREGIVYEGGAEEAAAAAWVVGTPARNHVPPGTHLDDRAVYAHDAIWHKLLTLSTLTVSTADWHIGAVPAVAALVQPAPAEPTLWCQRRAAPARHDPPHREAGRQRHRLAWREEGGDVQQQALLAMELLVEEGARDAELKLPLQHDPRQQRRTILGVCRA